MITKIARLFFLTMFASHTLFAQGLESEPTSIELDTQAHKMELESIRKNAIFRLNSLPRKGHANRQFPMCSDVIKTYEKMKQDSYSATQKRRHGTISAFPEDMKLTLDWDVIEEDHKSAEDHFNAKEQLEPNSQGCFDYKTNINVLVESPNGDPDKNYTQISFSSLFNNPYFENISKNAQHSVEEMWIGHLDELMTKASNRNFYILSSTYGIIDTRINNTTDRHGIQGDQHFVRDCWEKIEKIEQHPATAETAMHRIHFTKDEGNSYFVDVTPNHHFAVPAYYYGPNSFSREFSLINQVNLDFGSAWVSASSIKDNLLEMNETHLFSRNWIYDEISVTNVEDFLYEEACWYCTFQAVRKYIYNIDTNKTQAYYVGRLNGRVLVHNGIGK